MISQQLDSLPISITFIPDGSVSLSPLAQFKGIVDGEAVFTMDGYAISGIEYEYGEAIHYKHEDPSYLKYLQSLNLQQPTKEDLHFAMSGMPRGFPFGF